MNEAGRLEGLDEGAWRELLGRKVSLRFRLHDDVQPFSEAIGVVMGVHPGPGGAFITVLSKRGERTTIAIEDVIAGKLFPI